MASALTKATVAWEGLTAAFADLIAREWRPAAHGAELACRDDLLGFLRGCIPEDCSVDREYRHSGTTLDLCVHWEGILFNGRLFIELKHELQDKGELDRLVGQIESIELREEGLLIVIVGKSDEGLIGRLRKRYRQRTSGTRMRIVSIETGIDGT